MIVRNRWSTLKPSSRLQLVIAGYILAFIAASAVVTLHVIVTGADRQGSDGMYALGDALFFLAAFTLASIPATTGALFLLRPYRWFWRAACVLALGIAATGIAAVVFGWIALIWARPLVSP